MNDTNIEFETIYSVKAHGGSVSGVLFIKDKKILVSSSYDDTVKIWKLETETPLCCHIFDIFGGYDVNSISRWDDNSFLCSTDDGNVYSLSLEHPYKLIKKFKVGQSVDDAIEEAELIPKDLKIFDIVKLYTNKMMKRGNESQEFAFAGKRDRIGVLGVVNYYSGEVVHYFGDIGITIISYSGIRQSFTFPNCVFLNNGRSFLRRTKNDKFLLLINVENGEIVKRFNKHELLIYGFENFMKQNREILVAGGSQKIVYFYDVSSGDLLRTFHTVKHICSFLILGMNHFLVAQGGNLMEIFDFHKIEDEIEKERKEKSEHKSKTNNSENNYLSSCYTREYKKNLSMFKIGDSISDLDSLTLVTDLSPFSCYSEGDEIRIAVASNDQNLYYVSIKNLQISIDRSFEVEQNVQDLKERIEYLLFNENRYVGKNEMVLKIEIDGGATVFDHEIIKYFVNNM